MGLITSDKTTILHGIKAGADLTGKEGYAVTRDGSGDAVLAGAATREVDVLVQGGASGREVTLGRHEVRVWVTEAVEWGERLRVHSDGSFRLADAVGDVGVGRALQDMGANQFAWAEVGDAAAEGETGALSWQKDAADGAAATATGEQPFYQNLTGRQQSLAKVEFLPAAALTAHDANNATITVAKRDAAGANKTTIASIETDTASGNWTAFVAKDFGALANAVLAAGWQLTVEIEKGGDGVVVPAGRLAVHAD